MPTGSPLRGSGTRELQPLTTTSGSSMLDSEVTLDRRNVCLTFVTVHKHLIGRRKSQRGIHHLHPGRRRSGRHEGAEFSFARPQSSLEKSFWCSRWMAYISLFSSGRS